LREAQKQEIFGKSLWKSLIHFSVKSKCSGETVMIDGPILTPDIERPRRTS
jgi:hypothetical protein